MEKQHQEASLFLECLTLYHRQDILEIIYILQSLCREEFPDLHV